MADCIITYFISHTKGHREIIPVLLIKRVNSSNNCGENITPCITQLMGNSLHLNQL